MSIEWREIHPGYMVSSDGRVGSRRRGGFRIMRQDERGGYLSVFFYSGDGISGRERKCVHRLVADAFLPPKPTPRHQVNHKDGDKTNNRADNLEWVTPSENKMHSINVLGRKAARGEAQGFAKLTEALVRDIRSRFSAGQLQKAIASDCGISQGHVSDIVNGKRWAWLDAEMSK